MAPNRNPPEQRLSPPALRSPLAPSRPEEVTRATDPSGPLNPGLRGGAGRGEAGRGGADGSVSRSLPAVRSSRGSLSSTLRVPVWRRPPRPAPAASASSPAPARRHGRCGRGRRGEATAERHETGQQGHRARHRQPAPGEAGRDAAAAFMREALGPGGWACGGTRRSRRSRQRLWDPARRLGARWLRAQSSAGT